MNPQNKDSIIDAAKVIAREGLDFAEQAADVMEREDDTSAAALLRITAAEFRRLLKTLDSADSLDAILDGPIPGRKGDV